MITSCRDERDECKRTSDDASKSNSDDIKTGISRLFREQHGRGPTYLLAMRCPVYRRRDSHPGVRTELENLVGNAKGEGPSGSPARPTVPMCRTGADCSVVAMRRGNSRGAKGAGHRVGIDMGQLATGGTRWSRRKAPAFHGWHEPCDRRRSSTDL